MHSEIPLELIQGYQNTIQNLQILKENLQRYPSGWIEAKKSGRKIYYYYRYIDANGIRRSEKVEDLDALQEIMDDRNALRVLERSYKKMREQFAHALKFFSVDLEHLEAETKRKRAELEEEEKRFQEELAKAQKKKYSTSYQYTTICGFRVISKSEMTISDTMTRKGIPHEYEKPLIIEGHVLKPDFTIYFRGKVYYWEHLGLMDNEEYRKQWEWKKEMYRKAGIIEGVNLIVSREALGLIFTQAMVEHMVASYFGV